MWQREGLTLALGTALAARLLQMRGSWCCPVYPQDSRDPERSPQARRVYLNGLPSASQQLHAEEGHCFSGRQKVQQKLLEQGHLAEETGSGGGAGQARIPPVAHLAFGHAFPF